MSVRACLQVGLGGDATFPEELRALGAESEQYVSRGGVVGCTKTIVDIVVATPGRLVDHMQVPDNKC